MSQIRVLSPFTEHSSQQLTLVNSLKSHPPPGSDTLSSRPLHPWIQNTVLGGILGTLGVAGTAAAVSQFLDEPFKAIHHARIGGLQGFFAGASGALAASFVPNKTTGTAVGALVGASTGALQALAFAPSKPKILMATLTGLVAGAAAGHVTVTVREHTHRGQLDHSPALVPAQNP